MRSFRRCPSALRLSSDYCGLTRDIVGHVDVGLRYQVRQSILGMVGARCRNGVLIHYADLGAFSYFCIVLRAVATSIRTMYCFPICRCSQGHNGILYILFHILVPSLKVIGVCRCHSSFCRARILILPLSQ